MTDLEQLYRHHATHVHRFCYWLSGDAAQADDLTSETFVRAWAGSGDVQAETARAYLLTIARNLFLKGRQRDARSAPLDPAMPDPAPPPDETFEDRETLDRAMKVLGRLNEQDRAALLLRVDQGLAYREIARALGISETAAKVKVHRARVRLRAVREKGVNR